MPMKPPQHRSAGWRPPEVAARERKAAVDRRRGSPAERGYDEAWRKVRRIALAQEPLCRFCQEAGRITPASVVDHIKPIAEAPHLRLDLSNLRSLCKYHHDQHTARTQGFAKSKT